MAAKGDRAALEPQALRLYVDGCNLSEISRQLEVSDTTLRRWKSESAVPGDEVDGWDRGRQQKRGNIQRLKDLFERQLEYVEGLAPEEVTAPMMDTLSKLGALVERWDKIEKARTVAADVVTEVRKRGLSDEAAEEIRSKILGVAS